MICQIVEDPEAETAVKTRIHRSIQIGFEAHTQAS